MTSWGQPNQEVLAPHSYTTTSNRQIAELLDQNIEADDSFATAMAHNSGQSAHLNVEGNVETALLGRNMDDSTPLSQHDNVCIRVPVRILVAIKNNLGRLMMSLVLLGGLALALIAVTSETFNPLLVIAAALTFILSAIMFRFSNTQS